MAHSELIIGGQKSGKSRRAEMLARAWLDEGIALDSPRRAVLVATGQPHDDEMRERIARHQRDRAERVPGMTTREVPLHLARELEDACAPDTLVVVDCLTLWLTNWLMPATGAPPSAQRLEEETQALMAVVRKPAGPLVLVGNEIGLGVIPMGREVRDFVDTLGRLNQRVAEACARVTLVAAGLSLTLKSPT